MMMIGNVRIKDGDRLITFLEVMAMNAELRKEILDLIKRIQELEKVAKL